MNRIEQLIRDRLGKKDASALQPLEPNVQQLYDDDWRLQFCPDQIALLTLVAQDFDLQMLSHQRLKWALSVVRSIAPRCQQLTFQKFDFFRITPPLSPAQWQQRGYQRVEQNLVKIKRREGQDSEVEVVPTTMFILEETPESAASYLVVKCCFTAHF